MLKLSSLRNIEINPYILLAYEYAIYKYVCMNKCTYMLLLMLKDVSFRK